MGEFIDNVLNEGPKKTVVIATLKYAHATPQNWGLTVRVTTAERESGVPAPVVLPVAETW